MPSLKRRGRKNRISKNRLYKNKKGGALTKISKMGNSTKESSTGLGSYNQFSDSSPSSLGTVTDDYDETYSNDESSPETVDFSPKTPSKMYNSFKDKTPSQFREIPIGKESPSGPLDIKPFSRASNLNGTSATSSTGFVSNKSQEPSPESSESETFGVSPDKLDSTSSVTDSQSSTGTDSTTSVTDSQSSTGTDSTSPVTSSSTAHSSASSTSSADKKEECYSKCKEKCDREGIKILGLDLSKIPLVGNFFTTQSKTTVGGKIDSRKKKNKGNKGKGKHGSSQNKTRKQKA
jgi:hypothetical protein